MNGLLLPFERGEIPMNEVRVIGVGGAGLACVHHLAEQWPEGPEWIGIDRDEAALERSRLHEEVLLLDSGAPDSETSELSHCRQLALESEPKLRAVLQGSRVVILLGGLGGATAGGVLPEICRLAREDGIVTVVLVSRPFAFEGDQTQRQAGESLLAIREQADLLVQFDHRRLSEWAGDVPMDQALLLGAEHMGQGVQALWNILARPGLFHLNPDSLQRMCQRAGGLVRMASAFDPNPGDGQALLDTLAVHPYLGRGHALATAKAAVVVVTGGCELRIQQVDDWVRGLRDLVSPAAILSLGVTLDPAWTGELAVTVLVAEEWTEIPESEPEFVPSVEESEQQIKLFEDSTQTGKPKTARPTQEDLDLEAVGKGRFRDVEPTLIGGEDLDIPTYRRRRIALNGNY